MRTQLYLIFLLCFSFNVFSSDDTVKYAYITTFDNVDAIVDDDEKASAEWFLSTYTSNGDLVTTASIKNNQTDLSQYKVIWIHLDKEDGIGAIPGEFKDTDVLSKITAYYQNGGNILLSTHATQYIVDLGRIDAARMPNIKGAGTGDSGDDTWSINANIGMTYDNSQHPIYANTTFSSTIEEHPVIPLIGSGHKEDHNCMWDLNTFGYSGNVLDAFEAENSALVLGTWGQVTDFCCAGIVEFRPTATYKGRCIAIGLAAYEWNQNTGTNSYLRNIKRLTEGAFQYLATDYNNNIELNLVAHFPMELDASKKQVTESVANRKFDVNNVKAVCENIPGAEGNALRFDGFSTYVNATFNSTMLNEQALSSTVWCAMESYPMMAVDAMSEDFTYIAGNMKDAQKSGFAFVINPHGKYGFQVYINERKISCFAPDKMPKYEWVHLSAVVSTNDRSVTLYKNNQLIARNSFSGSAINPGTRAIIIGKSYDDVWNGPSYMNTINGLIDDFRVYAGEITVPETAPVPQHAADLTIPSYRFDDEIQRPVFHGMPAANWTNEPHGLIFYNDKYHMFFQKNGNGPYMSHQHWGHIVSDDLITWREERPAVTPDDWYDIKGAWSGCIFMDDELTEGKPHIFYTAVDFTKASIAEAYPLDDDLINWQKADNNPIIAHRPDGLDDDFRDPVMFKAHGKYFMIVGSKKGGKGVATLHEYNAATKTWSNDGRIFYQASSKDYGEFWEMPAIVQMSQDKWIFTATPLGGKNGVESVYWVGNINQDGTFNPLSHTPKEVELSNMSKDGFGMLSPSIMQKDGKTIVSGIVPDKLSGQDNFNMGWAHTFSLPREWSLDENNNLVQKPYEGLRAMRNNAATFSNTNFNLSNAMSLNPVQGKEAELEAEFTVSSDRNQTFGFNVRKNGDKAIKVQYKPWDNKFTVDARSVDRLSNDGWIFNGLYESSLPKTFAEGEIIKMHIFIDHSIMDIFINDTWAFSIRVFPTDKYADGIEIFSEGVTAVKSVNAWAYNQDDGIGTSNIAKSDENDFEVYFSDNQLCLKNVPENSEIMVFDQIGRLLVKDIYKNNTTGIYLNQKQIYIVCITTKTYSATKKVIKY